MLSACRTDSVHRREVCVAARGRSGVLEDPGAPGGIDGDPGAVAVTWAARALFVGLALVALALVEWERIFGVIRTSQTRG